ncbi:MAG: D-alanyl-D-alanine carboxypeptidase [Eubacteriales bacterium]|nr:D-alanyl-D-alanine carboxypeptidase [Eubacteriales bacterium]MDD4584197.1 D-alanyl-D-alanine carboxypeptidase [Eubacteriales bacterium]
MFQYKRIAVLTVVFLIIMAFAMPLMIFGEVTGGAKAEKTVPDLAITAKGSALLDADSSTFLFEQNSHERLPPASITKIMTMLLVIEAVERGQIGLQDQVTISERAASMGGSQMYMEQGEQQTVETLLQGMAIASANDACVACAEYVGGTEQIFVDMMNKRAKELGMKDTNFVNTNGLPAPDHYTSAYDIGLMSRELLKHEKTKEWFNTWQSTVIVGLKNKKQTELGLTNTNRLIKLYPGANGIKTGFTQEAGYCLAGSATKGDLTLISVVLGCETTHIRWGEAMRLLDYGFAAYDSVKVADKGEVLGTVIVEKGSPSLVNAIAEEKISLLVKKGEAGQVVKSSVLFKKISAPLTSGEPIGELLVYKNDQEIGRYPLVAETDIERAGLFEIYKRMLNTMM